MPKQDKLQLRPITLKIAALVLTRLGSLLEVLISGGYVTTTYGSIFINVRNAVFSLARRADERVMSQEGKF